MSHAYTTTNTKKRKSKVSAAKYMQDWVDYNKQMKRIGAKTKTFDEYIAYRQGKSNPKLKGGVKNPMEATTLRRETPKYESGVGIGVTFGRKENVYTGTLIKGIATMHKSNAVPIISEEQAHEVARMRRG
jgi:tRNA 2-selenouridine synthase SelU